MTYNVFGETLNLTLLDSTAELGLVCYFVLFACSLVVSTSANDCLERLVPEMSYCVLSGTLNSHYYILLSKTWYFKRDIQVQDDLSSSSLYLSSL